MGTVRHSLSEDFNMKYMKITPSIITFCLIILLDLIICYVVSVSMGHVYRFVPFVSETGNHPPDSCIFTIITTICSLCTFVCAWFCSQQVENYVGQLKHGGQHSDILVANKMCYLVGIFTAVNLLGLAHFQEFNLFTIHMITALSFFVGSALFMLIQSSISRHTQLCTPFTSKLRRRQAQFQTLMVFLLIVFGAVAKLQSNGKHLRDLTPADHGHLFHALSAICEYAAVINLAIYVLTFCKETLHMSIQLPEVYLVGDGHRVHDRPSEGDSPTSNSMLSALCYMLSKVIGINC